MSSPSGIAAPTPGVAILLALTASLVSGGVLVLVSAPSHAEGPAESTEAPAGALTGGAGQMTAAGGPTPAAPGEAPASIVLVATPGPGVGHVTLAWELPSWIAPESVLEHVVERSPAPDGSFQEVGRLDGTAYVDVAPVPGATYYYRGSAHDAEGVVATSPTEPAVAYPASAALPTPELGSLILTAAGLGALAVAALTRRARS